MHCIQTLLIFLDLTHTRYFWVIYDVEDLKTLHLRFKPHSMLDKIWLLNIMLSQPQEYLLNKHLRATVAQKFWLLQQRYPKPGRPYLRLEISQIYHQRRCSRESFEHSLQSSLCNGAVSALRMICKWGCKQWHTRNKSKGPKTQHTQKSCRCCSECEVDRPINELKSDLIRVLRYEVLDLLEEGGSHFHGRCK